MKPSQETILYGGIIVLAIGLTLVSLGFVWPVDCQRFCDAPDQAACPSGSCRPGDQRAGLPLPVVVDNPGGSSPTSGWGILGPEDLPNPATFGFDVIFYSALLWVIWYAAQIIRGRERPVDLVALLLPLPVVAMGLVVGLFLYWPVLIR